MDDVIYEEFKGTGNLELQLSRELSERRIFPAIDIKKSGTRKEELLMPSEELEEIWKLRKNMTGDSLEYTEQLIVNFMKKTKTNRGCFQSISKMFPLVGKKRVEIKKDNCIVESCHDSIFMLRIAKITLNQQMIQGKGAKKSMKQGIHPEYHPVVFMDSTTGFKFLSGSTKSSQETVEWEDGKHLPSNPCRSYF
jgi:hypothetical protein